jgi:hypothetical protein
VPASPPPLMIDEAGLPGPFEVPMCGLCREPFEAGFASVAQLVWDYGRKPVEAIAV